MTSPFGHRSSAGAGAPMLGSQRLVHVRRSPGTSIPPRARQLPGWPTLTRAARAFLPQFGGFLPAERRMVERYPRSAPIRPFFQSLDQCPRQRADRAKRACVVVQNPSPFATYNGVRGFDGAQKVVVRETASV